MTTAMPGYGTELSDNLILGHIAWYTIAKPQVTQPEMADIITTLGMSQKIIPKEPRPGDAFKRACRYSERSGLEIPLSTDQANFLIRKVKTDSTEVERHLVLERVDAEGKHLEYIIAAKLTFDRTADKLQVSKRQLPENLDGLVVETLNLFHTNFENALIYIDAQVIRRMIRDQMGLKGGIAIRPQGSVYFMPIRSKDTTQALEKFCQHMGEGSVFNSIPLPDTTKQREMIRAAFEDEVHKEATQVITELRKVQVTGEQITARAWTDYRAKLQRLQGNFTTYGGLVTTEMTKAETELEAVEKQLKVLMTDGLVKS